MQEPFCHGSVKNANGDFQFHLGVPQETQKNTWNGIKNKCPPTYTQSTMPALGPQEARNYTPGIPCKAEKALPTPTFGLRPFSGNRKPTELQFDQPKPQLQRILCPLNTRRLKPIRQKTKNAVVSIILHFKRIAGFQCLHYKN